MTKKVKEKVESRNELESYVYSLKTQLQDKEKLGGKLSEDDKTKIEEAVEENIKWLENNQDVEASEYKAKKKEFEEIVQPIITKLYQSAGGAPKPEGAGESDDAEKDEL